MSGAGLQRRRGAPVAGVLNDEDVDSGRPSRTSSPANGNGTAGPSSGAGSSSKSGPVPSSSAGQPHHRIAYDPRDLDDEDETERHPRLTLMEECLLLGLKDRQGYLSFWNDNISYTLRGCILIELALRGRIAITRDAARRRLALQDRLLEVVDGKMTGEVLLDEALKMMKAGEAHSATQWVDLMSGETWNVMKIGYQLKQVRERLAKGLVDKGVLRTEKRNFLLFDMATHPVSDTSSKDAVLRRILTLLCSSTPTVHRPAFYREERAPDRIVLRVTRAMSLLCCAFSANVLENALTHLGYEAREAAFQKADDVLNEFSQWPMAPSGGGGVGGQQRAPGLGEGSLEDPTRVRGEDDGAARGVGIQEMARAVREELTSQGNELQFECIAAVLQVLSRMDSLVSMETQFEPQLIDR